MVETRKATGNSRPRLFPVVESTAPATKKRTTKKPAAKKTTGGRVTKPAVTTTTTTTKAPAAHHKRKPTVADKVKGTAKKVAGAVERKPAKKAAATAEIRGHDGKKKALKK